MNLVGLFGSLCIIAWRNHYSIDVLLAFFITQVTWRYYFAKLDLLLLTRSPSTAFDHVIVWLEQMKPPKDSSRIVYSTIAEKLVLDSSSSSDDEVPRSRLFLPSCDHLYRIKFLTLPLQLVLELESYSPKFKSKEPLSSAQLAVTSTFLA